MKKTTAAKILGLVLSVTMLFASGALADSIIFDGTVESSEAVQVYAPIGGTIAKVQVSVGDTVKAGDVIASYKTTKVYADFDGVVSGIFGQPGDNAETVGNRYGAVMYIEDSVRYNISASTDNAYATTETKFIHVGETVNIKSRTDSSHTAVGIVTSVDGVDYTVEVQSGELMTDESVEIFRGDSYSYTMRLGRGTVERKNPTAVTGSGSIVSFAVNDGDSVKRGDLLFETLDGSFDGMYMSGTDIYASTDGVVGELNLSVGQQVQKDTMVMQIYPQSTMVLSGEVSEEDLSYIKIGDKVSIELNWNMENGTIYEGAVRSISSIATQAEGQSTESNNVTFTVLIDFTPDSETRYGMSAVITTAE